MTHATVGATASNTTLRDFVSLTKPRIISLLLVTTIAPMYVAGSPGWSTVLLVALGGYLMAGGANAVNMYLDRDIDETMARTRLRPIPGGRLAPAAVLAFGVALAAAAPRLLAAFARNDPFVFTSTRAAFHVPDSVPPPFTRSSSVVKSGLSASFTPLSTHVSVPLALAVHLLP